MEDTSRFEAPPRAAGQSEAVASQIRNLFDRLESSPWRAAVVRAGKCIALRFHAPEASSVLVFEFSSSGFDIGFALLQRCDGVTTSAIGQRRYEADQIHRGTFKMPTGLGLEWVELEWDNSYSRLRSKRLRYRAIQVRDDAPAASPLAAPPLAARALEPSPERTGEVPARGKPTLRLDAPPRRAKRPPEDHAAARERTLLALEAAVEAAVQQFMMAPSRPLSCSSTIARPLVEAIEATLRHKVCLSEREGSHPAVVLASSDFDDVGSFNIATDKALSRVLGRIGETERDDERDGTPSSPLRRARCTDTEQDGRLVRLAHSRAFQSAAPPRQSSVRLGWGAARHALILWLNHGVLGAALSTLIGHRALLLRNYSDESIMLIPSARERVLALAEALRGVAFHLENWVLADAPSLPTPPRQWLGLRPATHEVRDSDERRGDDAAESAHRARDDAADSTHRLLAAWGARDCISFLLGPAPVRQVTLRPQSTLETEATDDDEMSVDDNPDDERVVVWQVEDHAHVQASVVIRGEFDEPSSPFEHELPRSEDAARRGWTPLPAGMGRWGAEAKLKLGSERLIRTVNIRYILAMRTASQVRAAKSAALESCMAATWAELGAASHPRHREGDEDAVDAARTPIATGGGAADASSAPSTPSAATNDRFVEMLADERYSKYFQMVKMGICREAVGIKMKAEGMSDDAVHLFVTEGKEAKAPSTPTPQQASAARASATRPPSDVQSAQRKRSNVQLRNVQWQALDKSRAERSVFGAQIGPKTVGDADVLALHSLFTTADRGRGRGRGSKAGRARGSAGPQPAVLSARRIGNAAIVLRKLAKTREAETIPKAFLQLELAKEELVALRELVPTADEARLLVKHVRKPDDEPLIEAEALMMSLARLPRAAEKVDAGITRACFPETVEHILRAANLITAASLEIMASRRLARVLELLLAIGNQLNSNARAEIADAVGFSLHSLIPLCETRATSSKITLLDFFVKFIVERGEAGLLSLRDDLGALERATHAPDFRAVGSELRACLASVKLAEDEARRDERELDAAKSAPAPAPRAAAREAKETFVPDGPVSSAGVEGPPESVDETPPLPMEIVPHLLPGEDSLAGALRLNQLWGSSDGDDGETQRLLRLVARWLEARSKARGDQQGTTSTRGPDPAPAAGGRGSLLDAIKQRGAKAAAAAPATNGASAVLNGTDPAPAGDRGSLLDAIKQRGAKAAAAPATNEAGASKRSANAPAGIPEKGGHSALMSGITAGPSRLRKVVRNANEPVTFEKPRRQFSKGIIEFVEHARAVEVREAQSAVDEMTATAHKLLEFFGEDQDKFETPQVFKILSRFRWLLQRAVASYERQHGEIIVVAEPLVGKRLATVLGPGLVESVRTSDAVVVVRLEWGAMAYLQRDAIIYGGDHVSTGFGQGEVVSVQHDG